MKTILFLCPVHKRHQYLEAAARQFAAIPGYIKILVYFKDRPTREVNDEVFRLHKELKRTTNNVLVCMHGIFPIVDGSQGDFPAAWGYMLKKVTNLYHFDFVGIWDDDMILSHPEKVPEVLENADLVYGPKLFLWDSIEQYNTRLEHNSVVFWRFREGDEFHAKAELQVHAPKGVHDDPQSRKCQLEDFILDFGFMTEIDRIMVFEREVKTGKIDGFTRPLVEEPKLKTLPDDLLEISRRVSKYFKA